MPLFDCKTASLAAQQRSDTLPAPGLPHNDTQMPSTMQPSVWQLPPLDVASLEQELWPLEEGDRLAAEVEGYFADMHLAQSHL